jgi:hypothetical protein
MVLGVLIPNLHMSYRGVFYMKGKSGLWHSYTSKKNGYSQKRLFLWMNWLHENGNDLKTWWFWGINKFTDTMKTYPT